MVGRFIGHDGKQRNTPSVRFGNIAMMPLEPLLHERGHKQESYLVEARSLPGYSGSPVFVWSPSLTARPKSVGESGKEEYAITEAFGPWLLGIDWCHLLTREPVREKGEDEKPTQQGWFVRSNSGMAGVIPIWKLDELLDIDELKEGRDRQEQQLKEEKARINTSLDITPLSSLRPDTQQPTKTNPEQGQLAVRT